MDACVGEGLEGGMGGCVDGPAGECVDVCTAGWVDG